MRRTRIVLADDHLILREGLRALLRAQPDLELVGEAADGLEAVRVVEQLRPDVLIVDIMMPGLTGLEVTRQVRRHWPQTRVVVLSMYADEEHVLEALRSGAAAYVLKECSAAELVLAVGAAAAGQRYLSQQLSQRAIVAYLEKAKSVPGDAYNTLTERERTVFHLAAEGRTNAEIAAQLSISRRTVEHHRAHMMEKIGLHSPTELVRYALRREILPLEAPRPPPPETGADEK